MSAARRNTSMAICSEEPGPPLAKDEFAGLGARRGDQVGQCLVGRRGLHHQHHRRRGEIAHRREILRRVVVAALERRIDDEGTRDQEQHAAVGVGALHHFGADDGAGARPVLDHHARAVLVADLLAHQAGEDVGPAAGRVRHDDPDDAVLRTASRAAAATQQTSKTDGPEHLVPPHRRSSRITFFIASACAVSRRRARAAKKRAAKQARSRRSAADYFPWIDTPPGPTLICSPSG